LASWQVPASQQEPDPDFGSSPTLFTGTVTPGGATRTLVGLIHKNGNFYVCDRLSIHTGPLVTIPIAQLGSCPDCGAGRISPAAWDGSKLYITGGLTSIAGKTVQGSIRAFDPNNLASPLWQSPLSAAPYGAVTAVPGLAFVGTGQSTTIVRTDTGAVAATLGSSQSSIFYAPATVAHGIVYLADTGGTLAAYR